MEMLSERNGNGKTAARNEVGDVEMWQNNEWLRDCTQRPRSGVASDTSLHVLVSSLDYSFI